MDKTNNISGRCHET